MTPRRDLATRQDIIALVDGFYDRVRADDLIGPIFDGIARVDWAAHLPKMYDFWEAVLFGAGNFKGNPMAVHRALARQAPLTSDAFDRWLALFRETVDERFAGAVAEDAKDRAQRIALAIQFHIAVDQMTTRV
jgi:hemoglobin